MYIQSGVFNYVRHREHGLLSRHRNQQLSLQQNLILNNECKTESIRSDNSSIKHNTKAFLLVMSIDKSYFAVATSENTVGIYCSLSGEMMFKLIGSICPIYTITWHPFFKNIIACSNLSGSVFIWDIFESNNKECNYQKVWSWSPFSSITYSIAFHPFRSIMTLARDREIRFIDWEKGEHIAHWRFYSEFSWVPWVSWSFVGSSIIVSVGNPQDDSELRSMIESIDIDKKSLSPIQSGCVHENNNGLCEICDTCDKMSMLDFGPPTFEEYKVNTVDLIRFVLSRPDDWFESIFICVDCQLRFRLWSNSIHIHNKYDPDDVNQKTQLPHDVESTFITVIESPIAPEIVWDFLQKLDSISLLDNRLKKFLVSKSDPALLTECRSLLRCVAMFERECLRQSICWSCIQQIHNWVLQQDDFCLFLYEAMIAVREIVMDRVQHYDLNMYKIDEKNCDKTEKASFDDQHVSPQHPSSFVESSLESHIHEIVSGKKKSQRNNSNTSQINGAPVNTDGHSHLCDKLDSNETTVPLTRKRSASFEENQAIPKDVPKKRLALLRLTLQFLQFYVSEPSRLGDLINIFLTNNLSHSGMLFGPSLNGSKIDSYSVRKWHLQPLGTTAQKISPRFDLTDSNIVVPCLIFSATGLTESSIRMSNCGRTVAVFVPQHSFRRIHSLNFPNSMVSKRKRRSSIIFNKCAMLPDSNDILKNPVIAIYSSEPEASCGQLLHYFEMPYDSISLDFSPLGDYLIVGLSGSQNQAFLWWRNDKSGDKSDGSIIGQSSDSRCNIGLILKIDNAYNEHRQPQQDVAATRVKHMLLQQIVNHEKSIIYQNFTDFIGSHGPVNCVIWNTAGGILYSTEPGAVFSIRFVGCTG